MPNLKHLLDELQELNVDPKQVKLPAPLYGNMIADAEVTSEQNEDQPGQESSRSLYAGRLLR